MSFCKFFIVGTMIFLNAYARTPIKDTLKKKIQSAPLNKNIPWSEVASINSLKLHFGQLAEGEVLSVLRTGQLDLSRFGKNAQKAFNELSPFSFVDVNGIPNLYFKELNQEEEILNLINTVNEVALSTISEYRRILSIQNASYNYFDSVMYVALALKGIKQDNPNIKLASLNLLDTVLKAGWFDPAFWALNSDNYYQSILSEYLIIQNPNRPLQHVFKIMPELTAMLFSEITRNWSKVKGLSPLQIRRAQHLSLRIATHCQETIEKNMYKDLLANLPAVFTDIDSGKKNLVSTIYDKNKINKQALCSESMIVLLEKY
jgi:hypothetical protein